MEKILIDSTKFIILSADKSGIEMIVDNWLYAQENKQEKVSIIDIQYSVREQGEIYCFILYQEQSN